MQYFDKNDYSDFITQLRPVLIVLVCWAHIPFIYGYASSAVSDTAWQTLLGTFLRDVISRGSVPILTLISGYLAYFSIQRKPNYARFIRDRTLRIFIPFLAWNTAFYGGLSLLDTQFGYTVNTAVVNYPEPGRAVEAILGINRLPIMPPLYFLRDLFLVSLLCPVFLLLSRHYIFASIFILSYAVCMFNIPTFYFHGYGVFYRQDILLFFFLGFLFARSGYTIPKPGLRESVAGALFLCAFSMTLTFWLAENKPDLLHYLTYRPVLGMIFILLLPYLFAAMQGAAHSRLGTLLTWLSPYSFTLFLSHFTLVYGFYELAGHTRFSVSNLSPLWWQIVFCIIYTLACLGLAVLLKKSLIYLSALTLRIRRQPVPASRFQ